MMPLHLRLEERYHALDRIHESLWNLHGEVLTYERAEQISIDLHRLDINTGATSDSVTPYFLPRTSFPSCRGMSGLEDLRLVRLFGRYGHCRLLYAYFDGSRLKVQFTEVLDFTDLVVEPPSGMIYPDLLESGMTYIDLMNRPKYYEGMDKLFKWTWPVLQGVTSENGIEHTT
ncbi:uncharacterized protein KD926_000862 [Aspergillus affinis]|uniref:uncharacterized protein n=1 Tax=Aspergillus affinis TaxID=1070780 RepID=UPI0022FE21EE|nr:uncharacterized protein KD926_000862 [Aspergillus affinis]KAI9037076.1 hypothetical protein KD926_000862 [Aspergillus affinis]